MKRLVLFVEGEGDADAASRLVTRVLTEANAWDAVFLDSSVFRVGSINHIAKDGYREWKRKLGACLKRPNVGGVLLLLDGDVAKVGEQEFCAAAIAKTLAREAVTLGAGKTFSVAAMFARQEYESWLIAGIESLAGKRLPDGRLIAPIGTVAPEENLEQSPRNAKGWLGDRIEGGYKPTRDQLAMTNMFDLQVVRERKLRSFRRLESALNEIVVAIRNEKHVSTPA